MPRQVPEKKRSKEATVKDDVKAILKEQCVHYRMPPANGYGKMGDFDFVCCVDGMYLGIETKRDDKEHPTELQTDNAVSTVASGGVALLIHKGNTHLIARTINEMRTRLANGSAVFSNLSHWVKAPAQPIDINDGAVLRRRKA